MDDHPNKKYQIIYNTWLYYYLKDKVTQIFLSNYSIIVLATNLTNNQRDYSKV